MYIFKEEIKLREGRHEHRGHHMHKEHWENRGLHQDENAKKRPHSAQTFRRGRAISFLDRLNVKRSTLMMQLDKPEYESIKQVISGELKATESIIQEFIHTFELHEAGLIDDKNGDGGDVK